MPTISNRHCQLRTCVMIFVSKEPPTRVLNECGMLFLAIFQTTSLKTSQSRVVSTPRPTINFQQRVEMARVISNHLRRDRVTHLPFQNHPTSTANARLPHFLKRLRIVRTTQKKNRQRMHTTCHVRTHADVHAMLATYIRSLLSPPPPQTCAYVPKILELLLIPL